MLTSIISDLRGATALAVAVVLASCQSSTPPDRFAQADRNGDGTLSPDEVTEYLVSGIFEARDTNGDGSITKAEWNPQMDAAEAREFDRRDANKDGVVTRAEAITYAKATGVFESDFRAADANRDGKVTRDEVRAYYASKE